MYELELIDGHEAAEEVRELILHVAEVCTQHQLALLAKVFGEGGAAYNLAVIHRLLHRHGRLDESKRIGALFADYKQGFGDPLVRATFLLGVKRVMRSDGQLNQEEVKDILSDFQVEDTPDLRDALKRMARSEGSGGAASWSFLDVFNLTTSSVTVAAIAKKVPWGRLAKLLLLRR